MRKYTGILSIIFSLFGASSIFLTKSFAFFADNMFPIAITSYIVALILALISEKGASKKIALALLIIIALVMVGFYAVTILFWNQP